MTGEVEISTPGVSGPRHLLIPDSYPARPPYAIPTDISLTLPPLTMNAMDRYYMKATSNAQSFAISGIPSPPSSDSSQNYTNRERSSMTHDNTLSLPVGRQTPPYSSPGSWNSTVAYAMAPSHDMNEQPAYDMSIAALAVRPRSQQQLPQQAFYTPPYGSPVMPAPSSLLGPQIAEVPNYTLPRTVSTYQSPLPPIAPSAHDYASPAYGHNPSSAGTYFLPAPGSFTWQPTPYSQPYIQSRMWEHQSQIYRPSRPTTIFGRLPREAWERVFQYLEYADRLRLQRGINRFWRESLKALDKRIKENPSDADFADMHSLVLQAENYSKHWAESTAAECGTHRGRPRNNARKARTPPQANDEDEESKRRKEQKGSLGCYHCFTVRPPEKFCLKTDVDDANVYGNNDVEDSYDMPNNVREGSAPRRYCLDCGIKKGFHPPNKYLERKRGIEVWICCGTYHDHGVMNCPTCRRGCPLTPVTRTSRRTTGQRSSPMSPPSSRAQKQRRTATVSRPGPGRSVGYAQQYQHSDGPQPWS